ncbi:hypothetical protein, partial [Persephonella sp.]
MKDILLKNGLKLFKSQIKQQLEETDFAELILRNLTPETKNMITEKIYLALIEGLKSFDDKEVAALTINAKNSLVKNLENSDDAIKNILHTAIDKGISSIENDTEVQKNINKTIKNILLEYLE